MLSVILCCAALFVVSTALPTGAPDSTCQDLMPSGPHVAGGVVEQATPNPWTIDVCDFDEIMGYYTYTPGMTYNSKWVSKGKIALFNQSLHKFKILWCFWILKLI